jgi:predicted  nucleic acid-binding Zn-ribbon protein
MSGGHMTEAEMLAGLVERLTSEAEMLQQQANSATRSVAELQERDRASFAREAAQRRAEINAVATLQSKLDEALARIERMREAGPRSALTAWQSARNRSAP